MSNKPKNRANKKQIETTLGQGTAAAIEQQKIHDLSILKKPINTNIIGIKQLLSLPNNATVEVQNYVNYECDILYECRLCRAIFRSLANFILHKRNYCTERFTRVYNSENSSGFVIDENTINVNRDKNQNKRGLGPVLETLYKKQEVAELVQTTLISDLSNDVRNYNRADGGDCLILQKIEDNDTAVFQTLAKSEGTNCDNSSLMKSEVMEIHNLADNEAVLGVDGKIRDFTTKNVPKLDLMCTECNLKFSTKKTLTSHIKYKHNKTCKVYPCPDCNETFANAWSVFRHLDKVHKRTRAQIRRVRLQVASTAITKVQNNKKKTKLVSTNDNGANQRTNSLECDADIRLCGGCGRRFERRAALQSHSQTCIRRIALLNTKQRSPTTQEETSEISNLATRKTKKPNKNDSGKSDNVKIVDGEVFKQKQETNVTNIDNMLDILGITKGNPPNKTDNNSDISVLNNNANDNRDEIYISDESCHSSPQLNQLNHDKKKRLKLSQISLNELDYLADENFLLKAAPYMKRNELKCISCQTHYASRYQLLWHMSLHFSWYRFQCTKCPFMSFNRYDCVDHAYLKHGTTVDLIDSTILPIPKWKIISMSHDFIKLDSDKLQDRNVPVPLKKPNWKLEVDGDRLETIILDDETDVILENPPNIGDNINNDDKDRNDIETIELLDDDKDPIIGENDTGIVKNETVTNNRPVRTRTKSYKNDFIYDLGKVLKLNDTAVKTNLGRVKRK